MPSITSAKMARSSSVEPAAASPGATGGSSGVGAGGKRGGEAGGASGASAARQQPLQSQPSRLISAQVKDSFSAAHDSLRPQGWAHGSSAPSWPAAAGIWQISRPRTAATDDRSRADGALRTRPVSESLGAGAGFPAPPPHTQSHTPSQPSAFVRVAQSTHRSKYIRPWALPEHESWPAADCTLLPSRRGIGAGGASAVSGKGSRRVVAAVCRGIGDSADGEEERKSMRSGAGCRRGKRRASRRDLATPRR